MSAEPKINFKKERYRLYGVLLPICSGKTTLFQNMKKHSLKLKKGTRLILMDIDEVVFDRDESERVLSATTSQEMLFPRLKDVISQSLLKYPKYRIIIITSNSEFLKYLGIHENKIRVLVQALPLFLEAISPLLSVKTTKETELFNTGDDDSDTDDEAKPEGQKLLKNQHVGAGILAVAGKLESSTDTPRKETSQRKIEDKSNSQGQLIKSYSSSTLPAKFASQLAAITGHIVTITNNEGHESVPITFEQEVINICKSRDRIMSDFKDTYQMYHTFDELFDLVIKEFDIQLKL